MDDSKEEDFFDWDSLLGNGRKVPTDEEQSLTVEYVAVRTTDNDFLRFLGEISGKIADWFLKWNTAWGDQFEVSFGVEANEDQD